MKRKKILITLGCLIGLLLVVGVSYAYWTKTFFQTENNVVTTDCFQIEFMEGNAINLSKAYPVSEEDGLKNTPYTFTIKNVCTSSANYQINLETLNPSGKKLPDAYLKANLMENNVSKITTKLESSLNTSTTIEGAEEAYKLLVGDLGPNETKEFSLRIWMHSDVEASDKDSMNAEYNGKISVITSYQYKDNRGTLMAVNRNEKYESVDAFWDYKENIRKVVFEDELKVHQDAEFSWDVSESQNGSVMGYLVKENASDEEIKMAMEAMFGMTIEEVRQEILESGATEEEFNAFLEEMKNNLRNEYVLYIQGDGGIIANQDSSSLFKNFSAISKIENLEYFDTSQVTNMAYMFSDCTSLTSLDLSNFNTNNVTNMHGMFYGSCSLLTLDLSSFNTSNVTDMNSMFASNRLNSENSFIELNLSSFDTSNVTDMSNMFLNCSSLVSLDLSNFNTSKVTDMNAMFYYCDSLRNLDLSNFNTSNVTDMNSMFEACSSLVGLDVSSFDTSKVTNMSYMFRHCKSLVSLDISSFDTSNVSDMREMFYSCGNLENLNLGLFDVTNVSYSGSIFSFLSNTVVIKVYSEDTKNWVLSQNADLNVYVDI